MQSSQNFLISGQSLLRSLISILLLVNCRCQANNLIVAGSQVALSTDYSTSQSELFDPTLLPNYDCECYIPDEPAEDTGLVFLSSSLIYFLFSIFFCL